MDLDRVSHLLLELLVLCLLLQLVLLNLLLRLASCVLYSLCAVYGCQLGVQYGDRWGYSHSLAALFISTCSLHGYLRRTYLAGQSSVPRARPERYMSCAQVEATRSTYVKERLNSRRVLGGLSQALVLHTSLGRSGGSPS